jgi:dTDP-D-glucose 4,6-dehydratase
LGLDSDEGIRIENNEDGRKIFINKNLLGTYSILIRTKKKSDKKDNEKHDKEYVEQILNYNEVTLVLEYIKEEADKFNIWLY